jgi:hypothetical protein
MPPMCLRCRIDRQWADPKDGTTRRTWKCDNENCGNNSVGMERALKEIRSGKFVKRLMDPRLG